MKVEEHVPLVGFLLGLAALVFFVVIFATGWNHAGVAPHRPPYPGCVADCGRR
jgi:hypothetical protein